MEIGEEIKKMPFLRLLIPLMFGIAAAARIDLSFIQLLVGAMASLGLFLIFRSGSFRSVLLFAALFLTGVMAVKRGERPSDLPYGERIVFTGDLIDYGHRKGRWDRTTLEIRAYRWEDSPGEWNFRPLKVTLFADTAYRVDLGDRITAIGYLNPLDTLGGSSGYARTLSARGYSGTVFLTPGRLFKKEEAVKQGWMDRLLFRAKKIQREMVRLIGNSSMGPDEKAVASALLAGDRRGIDPELREHYSVTGAAHLLAVSGLHLGIIFMIVYFLSAPLSLMRYGRVYRSLAVIAALGAFAFLSGLSASVLRAASMFTLLQLSWTASGRYHSYNALLASAFVLLLVRPGFLDDLSFRLSYLALLGILFFYPRLRRWFGIGRASEWFYRIGRESTGWKKMVTLTSGKIFVFSAEATLVGVSAQLFVLPLIGATFGRIPLIGLLLNALVIPVVTLAMIAGGMFLLVASLSGGALYFDKILGFLIRLQNGLVGSAAGVPGSSLEIRTYPPEVVYLLYGILALVLIGIKYRESVKSKTTHE